MRERKTIRLQSSATKGRGGRARQLRLSQPRRGLSLLEVILSIAILGGAMVMIGQLYHLGYRSALQARLRNDANIIADSKMAELAAGVLPLESTGNSELPEYPGWSYSVDLQSSLQLGLFMATVTVSYGDESSNIPTSLSIVRFIPDPDYEPEEDEE
jgi:prepilin-type N-terminal cleavage/methylation domain-containing protein